METKLVFEGKGVVWDAFKSKALCKFSNGLFITDNDYIIGKMKDLGYKYKKYNPEEMEKEIKPEDELERLGTWILTNFPDAEGLPVDIAINTMNEYKKIKTVEEVNKRPLADMMGGLNEHGKTD